MQVIQIDVQGASQDPARQNTSQVSICYLDPRAFSLWSNWLQWYCKCAAVVLTGHVPLYEDKQQANSPREARRAGMEPSFNDGVVVRSR